MRWIDVKATIWFAVADANIYLPTASVWTSYVDVRGVRMKQRTPRLDRIYSETTYGRIISLSSCSTM
jgi:hypothetical protein